MDRVPALTVNWTTLLAATLLQIPLLWTDQKVLRAGFASVALSDWLALAYLVVFATAIARARSLAVRVKVSARRARRCSAS